MEKENISVRKRGMFGSSVFLAVYVVGLIGWYGFGKHPVPIQAGVYITLWGVGMILSILCRNWQPGKAVKWFGTIAAMLFFAITANSLSMDPLVPYFINLAGSLAAGTVLLGVFL